MKNKFKIFPLIILIVGLIGFGMSQITVNSEQVLHGYVQKVPDNFFGTWRVKAKRIETDSPGNFKEKTIDLWNISQSGDVIKLSNPFSGAEAQLQIDNSENQIIEFTKTGRYDNKILTDKVIIQIDNTNFTGIDTLKLDTISDIDGSVKKSVTATYSIKGERLSGQKIYDK